MRNYKRVCALAQTLIIVYSFLFSRWKVVSVVKYQRAVHIRFYIRIDQNHDSVWQNVATVYREFGYTCGQDRCIIYVQIKHSFTAQAGGISAVNYL